MTVLHDPPSCPLIGQENSEYRHNSSFRRRAWNFEFNCVVDYGYPESFLLSNEFTCLLLVSSDVFLRVHSEIWESVLKGHRTKGGQHQDPVSPPFSSGEGTIWTSSSNISTHILPSSSSASTIPEGLALRTSTSEEESLLARGRDNGKYSCPFNLPEIKLIFPFRRELDLVEREKRDVEGSD